MHPFGRLALLLVAIATTLLPAVPVVVMAGRYRPYRPPPTTPPKPARPSPPPAVLLLPCDDCWYCNRTYGAEETLAAAAVPVPEVAAAGRRRVYRPPPPPTPPLPAVMCDCWYCNRTYGPESLGGTAVPSQLTGKETAYKPTREPAAASSSPPAV